MHVLHCNTYDTGGGAAIASRNLHAALLRQGVVSHFAVVRPTDNDPSVFSLVGPWRRLFDPLVQRFEQMPLRKWGRKKTGLFSPAFNPARVHRRINAQLADIVHLHWVTAAFVPLWSMARVRAPLVWTLHDAWAFTGGCHYPDACSEYKISCHQCPYFYSLHFQHLAMLHFQWKQRAYARLRPVFVAPSHAFFQTAQNSALLHDQRIRVIPNGIDPERYFPCDNVAAKIALGVPHDAVCILFGAVGGVADQRKGFDLLTRALEALPQYTTRPLLLLIFGASHAPDMASSYPMHCLGRLHDDIALRLAYSAADVFVCPSREESFSLTTLESLACGTPVAGFAVGGIPDMVEHQENGWLAPPHDPVALAQGIAWILEDRERHARLRANARRVVEERYTLPMVARQYMELYAEIIDEHARRV